MIQAILVCDRCQDRLLVAQGTGYLLATTLGLRKRAKAQGWTRTDMSPAGKDLCPPCSRVIPH